MSKKSLIKEMRALSVIQPWAHCIVKKGKSVENRVWSTERRGYFLIHASKSVDKDGFEYCGENYSFNLRPEDVAFSSIVGIAKLAGVVTKRTVEEKDKKWFQGKFGLVLSNVIYLKKPVKAKGALGFWKVKGATLKKVLAQIPAKKRMKIAEELLFKAS